MLREIELHIENKLDSVIEKIADVSYCVDYHKVSIKGNKRTKFTFLILSKNVQDFLDQVQPKIKKDAKYRLIIKDVEGTLPAVKEEKDDGKKANGSKSSYSDISREELHNDVAKGAVINSNYILLTLCSSIVATIGLLEGNVAVIIGAMVIAPLLGPNLALALSSALGEMSLMLKSLRTIAVGVLISVAAAFAIGMAVDINIEEHEIVSRTIAEYDSIILALAAGVAGVLSLTAGVSSALVGVMVAVALLPPIAVVGLMLGSGNYELAFGAALLFSVNIVCINLAAKLVFLAKGIRPRTWFAQKRAAKVMFFYITTWVVTLGLLVAVIYLKKNGYTF
jgi:uncharacterized hydrophobic protein (TIGR00341 family)